MRKQQIVIEDYFFAALDTCHFLKQFFDYMSIISVVHVTDQWICHSFP